MAETETKAWISPGGPRCPTSPMPESSSSIFRDTESLEAEAETGREIA
ncbi:MULTISPECIES: hypothetical protein [unclassified Mesorhizobium]|nr:MULTISPECIES: hypothetical protein [unclassified Mesorhizobium]